MVRYNEGMKVSWYPGEGFVCSLCGVEKPFTDDFHCEDARCDNDNGYDLCGPCGRARLARVNARRTGTEVPTAFNRSIRCPRGYVHFFVLL
jgi:hypothetical protein